MTADGGDVASRVEDASRILGPRARRHVPIGPLTTYRAGGPASLFMQIADEGDLARVAEAVGSTGVPVLIVGRGSNLLVADSGFVGLALVLGDNYAALSITGTTVSTGAAVALPVLARRSAGAGLTGLEWAVGVPGSVGGAVRMNAGGHGSDISRTLVHARIIDLAEGMSAEVHSVRAEDLGLGYRRSSIGPSRLVMAADFRLECGDLRETEQRLAEVVRWRREHQPGGANAGSVFANPPNDSAGRLIEAAGLRGHRRGSAFVSPKHANFFQCDPNGSADDVISLIAEVATAVEARFGVRLAPEVQVIGAAKSEVSTLDGGRPAAPDPLDGPPSNPSATGSPPSRSSET